MTTKTKWLGRAAAVLIAGAVAIVAWQQFDRKGRDDGLASGNGRIEATEISVAAKVPGRISAILVREGDFVSAGQVVARMDNTTLQAQLRQAQAQLGQALSAVETARSQLALAESQKAAAQAAVLQREAELLAARKQAERSAELSQRGAVSHQVADNDHAHMLSAQAAVSAARAQVAATEAGIVAARSQIGGAQSAVDAMQATTERIVAEIDDGELVAPRSGRVQYLVAHVGEVVAAGGRVLNLVDLSDVYMTFFLPTPAAGRIALGTDVRLVLDAAPQFVIPANVSFVADVAQFTPKTVQTALEREKLMFRVRARIPAELLEKYILSVKTGLPGMAHVRLDPAAPWPAHLEVRLPE